MLLHYLKLSGVGVSKEVLELGEGVAMFKGKEVKNQNKQKLYYFKGCSFQWLI